MIIAITCAVAIVVIVFVLGVRPKDIPPPEPVSAVAALAQTASEKPSLDVRRVGMRLQCQCGCKDSVATCSMLECGFSKPAKEKIARMLALGMTDQQIIDDFVDRKSVV